MSYTIMFLLFIRKHSILYNYHQVILFSICQLLPLKNIFLSPQSIAVIGASEKAGVGKAIFSNIINGYKGKIYPVTHPILQCPGLRAYKSVLDIPQNIDLAVIATPNRIVPAVMEEVGRKNIKGAIIVSDWL